MSRAVAGGLADRRIFLTGGTGFVGCTLLDWLSVARDESRADFQVTVLSRNPAAFLHRHPEYANKSWLRFVQGSLDELPHTVDKYTDVIHAAADTHLQGQAAAWISQIVVGTRNVLEFALRSGAERFLLTSSGAIYGPQPPDVDRLAEDCRIAPLTSSPSSTYGQAKRVAEQLCTAFQHEHGLSTVVARLFSFCGKHVPLDGPYAIGNFIRDALRGEDIRVKGDGTAVRSYLSGEEVAHWLIHLLRQAEPGEAYNVGSDQAVSMSELAHTVCRLLVPRNRVIIENALPDAALARSKYVPSIEKAQLLGLTPKYSLNEIVLNTTAAMLNRSH
jgi:dTDP-glucose 4,6-dehydratase